MKNDTDPTASESDPKPWHYDICILRAYSMRNRARDPAPGSAWIRFKINFASGSWIRQR